jgi:hypothetical protein
VRRIPSGLSGFCQIYRHKRQSVEENVCAAPRFGLDYLQVARNCGGGGSKNASPDCFELRQFQSTDLFDTIAGEIELGFNAEGATAPGNSQAKGPQ